MKICWKFTHSQTIQDVDEFVSSSKQIWRNLALHHLLTNGLFLIQTCIFLINWSIRFVWINHYVFISCLDSHSDSTHSLQKIHWWASDVMLNFSRSVRMKTNSSTSWSAWGWVNCQNFFSSWKSLPNVQFFL